MQAPREQAHTLIEMIPPEHLAEAVTLLATLVDPYEQALARARIDDEVLSEEEIRAADEGRRDIAEGRVSSMEEVLAGFGLTMGDFEQMGELPLESDTEAT